MLLSRFFYAITADYRNILPHFCNNIAKRNLLLNYFMNLCRVFALDSRNVSF